jgi:hypothetical protein
LLRAGRENKAWDIAGADVINSILGCEHGFLNIGVGADLSATNQLIGTRKGADLWPPKSVKNLPIVVKEKSTEEYVARACLESEGFSEEDIMFEYCHPTNYCIEALIGEGRVHSAIIGAYQFPETVEILDSAKDHDALTICTGASVDATVANSILVDGSFAEENPDKVARVLTGWLRAVAFMNDPDKEWETKHYISEFLTLNGVEISEGSRKTHADLVGLFGLEIQLNLMERRGKPALSNYDIWTNDVGRFMKDKKMLEGGEIPLPWSCISDKYMQMVRADPELNDFATRKCPDPYKSPESSSNNYPNILLSFVVIGCCVVLAGQYLWSWSRFRWTASAVTKDARHHQYSLVDAPPCYVEMAESS